MKCAAGQREKAGNSWNRGTDLGEGVGLETSVFFLSEKTRTSPASCMIRTRLPSLDVVCLLVGSCFIVSLSLADRTPKGGAEWTSCLDAGVKISLRSISVCLFLVSVILSDERVASIAWVLLDTSWTSSSTSTGSFSFLRVCCWFFTSGILKFANLTS